MTVAAAAAPWSSEEASEQGSGERELLRGAAEKRMLRRGEFRKQKLRAYINDNGIKIKVQATQEEPGKAKWEITISELGDFSTGGCSTGLKWHVHELPLGDSNGWKGHGTESTSGAAPVSAGECLKTGGHWDPFFACGGKSQHAAGICTLYPGIGAGGAHYTGAGSCGDGVAKKCEMGDLNGKMGLLPFAGKLGMKQTFYDEANIQPLSEIKGRSIVFHCGSPRVACANFQ